MSERALGQGLGRTRTPHTTAVGLMPPAQVAVFTPPIAQMGKLRHGPRKSEIKEEANGHVANLPQNLMISSDTQGLLKFGIALVITSWEKQGASWEV